MAERIDRALRPLVDALRARYPHVRVIEARLTRWDDGFLQQLVRYRAPLAELRRCGLATDEMLKGRKARGSTALGDGYHLCESPVIGTRGEPCWELDLCTESAPREVDMELHEARAVLRRMSDACKPQSER